MTPLTHGIQEIQEIGVIVGEKSNKTEKTSRCCARQEENMKGLIDLDYTYIYENNGGWQIT